jgi:hypothetical protein
MGYRSNRICDSFIEDQFAASSEGGTEVCSRCEPSAGDLPVRSVRAGNATGAFDSTGHHHAGAGFGCGAGQDRLCSTADE